jgi:hypothetical protein
MVRVFKAKIRFLRSIMVPMTLIWLLNLRFMSGVFLCLVVCVL